MIKSIKKINLIIYSCLFLSAFFICCSSALNPFGCNIINIDTSVYLTIARGITEGQVPYRDFFDNKGPLMYLINALGLFLGGFTGVWIIQLILMYISLFFAYKTALFFGNKFSAFFSVLFSFLIFRMFYYEVAGAEYSLPFIIISLYIFTKYYFNKTKPSIIELITVGLCFTASVLIRINLFSLWLSFGLVILIETIIKKDFLSLIKYIICFFTGILILLIPVFLYLYLNNALSDYVSQNIYAGSSMGFYSFSIKKTIKSFFTIIDKNYSFIPLVIGSFWIIINLKTEYLFYYTGFILAFIFSVLFHAIITTNYDHYNIILVPFNVPALAFFIQIISFCFSGLKYRKIAILIFLCVIFSGQITAFASGTKSGLTGKSRYEITDLAKKIDQNTEEGDEIISLGLDCQIYLFTNRRPASRFIYQSSGAEHYPDMIPEFLYDMMNKKPAVIIMKKDHLNWFPVWYSPIFEMIDNEYHTLSDYGNYLIFKRNNKECGPIS